MGGGGVNHPKVCEFRNVGGKSAAYSATFAAPELGGMRCAFPLYTPALRASSSTSWSGFLPRLRGRVGGSLLPHDLPFGLGAEVVETELDLRLGELLPLSAEV